MLGKINGFSCKKFCIYIEYKITISNILLLISLFISKLSICSITLKINLNCGNNLTLDSTRNQKLIISYIIHTFFVLFNEIRNFLNYHFQYEKPSIKIKISFFNPQKNFPILFLARNFQRDIYISRKLM